MVTDSIVAAMQQVWPAFVLVAGLILIGRVAAADGLFEAVGGRLGSLPLRPPALLIVLLTLVAVVTAVLNLDTAVVFLTPVLVHAARRRGLDERPFLYGSIFMANASSIFLPGANLTNLLVLRNEAEAPMTFAARMLPAGVAACSVTAAFLAVAFGFQRAERSSPTPPPLRLRSGAAATSAAALLLLMLPNAAVPVFAVGVIATAVRRLPPHVGSPTLVLLLLVSVIVGTAARLWTAPSHLLRDSTPWAAAGVGALAAVLINNLPATALLSSGTLPHPDALLLGLDIGPNLAVTGSLSALLWLRAARSVGARPSLVTYSRLGVILVPLTLAVAVAVLSTQVG
jgi:arsenical pump membrane protein